MYLLAISDCGRHHCGSDYTHQIASRNDMDFYYRAAQMAKITKGIKEVWGMRVYTQQMCEMDNAQFVNHIRRNGVRLF